MRDEVAELVGVEVHELVDAAHGSVAGVGREGALTDGRASGEDAEVFVEVGYERAKGFR